MRRRRHSKRAVLRPPPCGPRVQCGTEQSLISRRCLCIALTSAASRTSSRHIVPLASTTTLSAAHPLRCPLSRIIPCPTFLTRASRLLQSTLAPPLHHRRRHRSLLLIVSPAVRRRATPAWRSCTTCHRCRRLHPFNGRSRAPPRPRHKITNPVL